MKIKSKLSKSILGISLSALIFYSCTEKFPSSTEYRNNPVGVPYLQNFDNSFFIVHNFDSDNNGLPDTRELYPADNLGTRLTNEPLFYFFDKNNNKIFELKEGYYDLETDGLNGNEIKLTEKVKKETIY